MNKALALLLSGLVLGSFTARAQNIGHGPLDLRTTDRDSSQQTVAAAGATDRSNAELYRQYIERLRNNFLPHYRYRVINGQTNYAWGPEWRHFCGRITQTTARGVFVSGSFGQPYDDPIVAIMQGDQRPLVDFFVMNVPPALTKTGVLTADQCLTAMVAPPYRYISPTGVARFIPCLEFGRICATPPEVIAAFKKAANDNRQKNADILARAVKFNQDAADKGDAFGLLRMGERYTKGDGVEKDLDKARDCLTKSAALGNATAQEELAALPKSGSQPTPAQSLGNPAQAATSPDQTNAPESHPASQ